MASIEYRKRTARVIAYLDGEKHCFPLGRVAKKTAERFANNIDSLLNERRCNVTLSREVANWLAGLDDSLYGLLVDQGIVEPRVKTRSISDFVDSYVQTRSDVTDRRCEKFHQAKTQLD